MVGEYRHAIDAKGRLFVPSKLREELGEVFYIARGLDGCIGVHTEAGWQKLVDKYNELPMNKTKTLRFFFATAAKCEPDKQGRFLIPQHLRNYAQLKQDVVFIGQAGHAEIWDAEAYDRLEAETLTPENLAAVMEELDF